MKMQKKIIYREPLGNPNRKYRQNKFMISSCRAWGSGDEKDPIERNPRRCIELCKELGCDLTEYIWASPEKTLEYINMCEEVGIDGNFQNWDAFGGFQAANGKLEVNKEKMEEFITYAKKFRHFHGYVVWDEPCTEEMIAAAAEQVNIIEKMDPERMPYTVAIPSYNELYTWENGMFEGYLKRYVNTVDPVVVSLDYYPFSSRKPEPSDQLDSSKLYLDIAALRKLALEKKTPMWFCVQAQDQPVGEKYYRFEPEKIRMQTYNAILHGAVGIQLYSTVEGAMYDDGRRGPIFYQIQDMNYRVHQLGKTLMALTSVGVFHSPELLKDNPNYDKYRQPLSDSLVLDEKELPYRCSIGEFVDREGNLYLMILNRDYRIGQKFELKLKQESRVYEVGKQDGEQFIKLDSAKNISLKMAAGDAVLLRFQDTCEEPYLIEYMLKL